MGDFFFFGAHGIFYRAFVSFLSLTHIFFSFQPLLYTRGFRFVTTMGNENSTEGEANPGQQNEAPREQPKKQLTEYGDDKMETERQRREKEEHAKEMKRQREEAQRK